MSHNFEISLSLQISEIPIHEVKLLDNLLRTLENRNNQAFKAVLTTKGRKSGREHSVWLRAVMYDDKIYFSRHRPDGDWFQNAIKNSDVKVQIDDSVFVGKTSEVKDEILAMKISELKYPNEERAKEKRVTIEVKLYEQL